MPNIRLPVEKVKAKGSHLKNPALFADRVEPKVEPLGPPAPHVAGHARVAWYSFVAELPWLAESDRAMLEVASLLRGRMLSGEDMPINALTLLRQCLQTLGATPADRSRVPAGDDPNRVVDPVEQFFQ